tara:strand:+ start:7666 stop:9453 length:1788 start_codon:yes stop_codon:yes gene_type:complete
MSFFTSTDKIKVGQTDVAVPAENGMNYKSNGKIDLYIPPTSKFIDLSQSRLKFKFAMDFPAFTTEKGPIHTQLDAQTGFHSLIRSIRIFTGRKTALLEEIEGYDVLTALRFDYETNQSLKSKRALVEGATDYDPACRGTLGTTKTPQGNCFSNQYFGSADGASVSTSFSDAADDNYELKEVIAELHLNTGLFRNEAVFPALLTDGLFIEILLQDKRRVFRQLDSCNRHRRLKLNPVFHSINGSENGSATNGSWQSGSGLGPANSFFVTRDNNVTSIQTFPLVVGEHITWVKAEDGSVVNASRSRIKQIDFETAASLGTSKVKVTCFENASNTTGETIGGTGRTKYVVVSDSVDNAAREGLGYAIGYTISDVEMIVKQIEVPDGYEASMMGMMKEGGTINYDYRTFTNYRYSQLKGDNVANIRLPLIESRATSILCIPTDATIYSDVAQLSCSTTYVENTELNDVENRSARSGMVGIVDDLQNYQFIYDGKINPSRRVDTTKISAKNSISQQWTIEAEKGLAMADIEPLSFLQFQSNFFIGRALALGRNAVYDARGKDFNLQLEYNNAQTKDKLWNNYVAHLRRLEIKQGSVAVMV